MKHWAWCHLYGKISNERTVIFGVLSGRPAGVEGGEAALVCETEDAGYSGNIGSRRLGRSRSKLPNPLDAR